MNNTLELKLKAIITEPIQKLLDKGELKIEGLQLRDSKGRFAQPLDTLIERDDDIYSTALLVQFQDEILVAHTLMKQEIRELFRIQSQALSEINTKIDTLLKNDMDSLNAKLIHLFSELEDIQESELTRIENILHSGGEATALIAQKLDIFIDTYLKSLEFYNQHRYYNTKAKITTLGEFNNCNDLTLQSHLYSKALYPSFKGSLAQIYIETFIELINSLNILNIIHRKRSSAYYEDNLDALQKKIVEFLYVLAIQDNQKTINTNLPGFRDMSYQINDNNGKLTFKGNPEAERLSHYFEEFTHDQLAVGSWGSSHIQYYDENLSLAISNILNILENIKNLKTRNYSIEIDEESKLRAISELTKKFFLKSNDIDD